MRSCFSETTEALVKQGQSRAEAIDAVVNESWKPYRQNQPLDIPPRLAGRTEKPKPEEIGTPAGPEVKTAYTPSDLVKQKLGLITETRELFTRKGLQ